MVPVDGIWLGIYLKGNARLNLTLEGDNTLLGLDHGAGIGGGKRATLVITENSTGSLRAVEVPMGPPVSEEMPDQQIPKVRTMGQETIRIKGGTISADGGAYWVPKRGIS